MIPLWFHSFQEGTTLFTPILPPAPSTHSLSREAIHVWAAGVSLQRANTYSNHTHIVTFLPPSFLKH